MTGWRERFASAPVARLATVAADGRPHIVPFTFAVDDDIVWSAVDDKPKRSRALRRLDNIRANPAVSALVDHYDHDWGRLWWARADGIAEIRDSAPEAVALLAGKYIPYRDQPPPGPFIKITVERWTGWQSRGAPPAGAGSPADPATPGSAPAP